MSACEQIAGRVTAWLRERGVEARNGWSGAERPGMSAPTVVVSVRSCEAVQGGFAHYLGERYNEETARWEELYGRRLELELGLDLYAPEQSDQGQVQELLEKLTAALTLEQPEGLRLEKLVCGELVWDQKQRRLRQEVTAKCTAWLRAAAPEETVFLDFELRGGWKP